ncbi:MAG TPA: phage head closure protein [Caproiciproducens sp.]|nr:phage head closure protein [Caproiciproducens sp.]
MKKLNANSLNRKITFQKLVETTNEVQETVQMPQDYLTTFAKISPVKPLTLKGGEYLDDQKSKPQLVYKITTRYRSDINKSMLIKYGYRIFQIIGILNFDEGNTFLDIECIEKVKP